MSREIRMVIVPGPPSSIAAQLGREIVRGYAQAVVQVAHELDDLQQTFNEGTPEQLRQWKPAQFRRTVRRWPWWE